MSKAVGKKTPESGCGWLFLHDALVMGTNKSALFARRAAYKWRKALKGAGWS